MSSQEAKEPGYVPVLTDTEHLRDESIRRMDTAIDTVFKLATGALALSVTFRGSVTGPNPNAVWLLVTSWIALAVVPIAYVVVQTMYGVAFSELLGSKAPHDQTEDNGEVASRASIYGAVAVIVMAISFMIGIALFVAFAVLNV